MVKAQEIEILLSLKLWKLFIHLNDIHSVGFMGNLTEYVMSRQFLSLLDVVVDSDDKQINFDRHKNRLHIRQLLNKDTK